MVVEPASPAGMGVSLSSVSMTAYSFGARWVGVVALREAPPPEPLHRMATRLRESSRSREVRVGRDGIAATELLTALWRVRLRLGLAGEVARARECLHVETLIRSGRTPRIRPWLRKILSEVTGYSRPPNSAGMRSPGEVSPTGATSKKHESGTDRIVPTGWAGAFPQAPDSPWLPPLEEPFAARLVSLGLELEDEAARWLRWACLHSSYLHEVPEAPIGPGLLHVLEALGRSWLRVGMLDRAQAVRGEFSSGDEVTAILRGEKDVRTNLAVWLSSLGAGFYGKGEAVFVASGRGKAGEAVALQVVGALSLVTASQAPADIFLDAINYQAPTGEPDWQSLLHAELKVEPRFERFEEGPDHNKRFTVAVTAAGRVASATAGSVKAARKSALREYVTTFIPHVIPRPKNVSTSARPHPYPPQSYPRHAQTVAWAQRAFEVADAGLITQALTHRSWVHENAVIVRGAHQRDCGTLAAEGSEVLTLLVRHHHALRLLGGSLQIPSSADTSPRIPSDVVATLFSAMPFAGGVLHSRGLSLSADVKSDVIQAVIAASWRANGDLLAERQPLEFGRWLRGFSPRTDAVTELGTLSARAGVAWNVDFASRGPEHAREFRATVTFEIDNRPGWRGNWESSKILAKQSATAGVLRHLLGEPLPNDANAEDGAAILRGLFLAELCAIDSVGVSPHRALAEGRLSVDLLAAGEYDSYRAWSRPRSALLSGTESAVVGRVSDFYSTVLVRLRRDVIRQLIIRHSPRRGVDASDLQNRIRSWWSGTDSSMLVLVEELLAHLYEGSQVSGILGYIGVQARVLASSAGRPLETEISAEEGATILTMRIQGAEFSASFEPVMRLIESIGVGATWAREAHAISVTIPLVPDSTNPIEAAAFGSVRDSFADPWLKHVHEALGAFLSTVEQASANDGDLSTEQIDALSLAASQLLFELRSSQ